jgi:undecaprenyl-diphosphatase
VSRTAGGAARPGHSSAVVRTFRLVAQRFGEGRDRIGPEAWHAWIRHIVIGAAGLLALMVLLILLARWLTATGALDWEPAFLTWLGRHGPFRFPSAVFFQTFGSDITLGILAAATAGIAAWMRRPVTSLSIIIAPLVPDLVGRAGWAMWARIRPDLLYDGIASPGFHAFPSGHSSKTTALYGLLTVLLWRASDSVIEKVLAGLALAFIATTVPFGRMAMGVHWPSDVLAGLLIGMVWMAVLARGLRFERAA